MQHWWHRSLRQALKAAEEALQIFRHLRYGKGAARGAEDPMTKPERNDPAPYGLVGMYSLWVFTLRCGKQVCVKSGTTYLFGTFSFSK